MNKVLDKKPLIDWFVHTNLTHISEHHARKSSETHAYRSGSHREFANAMQSDALGKFCTVNPDGLKQSTRKEVFLASDELKFLVYAQYNNLKSIIAQWTAPCTLPLRARVLCECVLACLGVPFDIIRDEITSNTTCFPPHLERGLQMAARLYIYRVHIYIFCIYIESIYIYRVPSAIYI